MAIPSNPISSIINTAVEEEVHKLLIQHFSPLYRESVLDYVNTLVTVDHYISRLLYLQSVLGDGIFHQNAKIFVSGCSVGSELIVARYFGFGEIHGVEVDEFLVDICKKGYIIFQTCMSPITPAITYHMQITDSTL